MSSKTLFTPSLGPLYFQGLWLFSSSLESRLRLSNKKYTGPLLQLKKSELPKCSPPILPCTLYELPSRQKSTDRCKVCYLSFRVYARLSLHRSSVHGINLSWNSLSDSVASARTNQPVSSCLSVCLLARTCVSISFLNAIEGKKKSSWKLSYANMGNG